MACEECYRYNQCKYYDVKAENCYYYINKNQVIELPCKIGDSVFYIDEDNEVYETSVLSFHLDCHGLSIRTVSIWFNVEEIGQRVVLTRAECENKKGV